MIKLVEHWRFVINLFEVGVTDEHSKLDLEFIDDNFQRIVQPFFLFFPNSTNDARLFEPIKSENFSSNTPNFSYLGGIFVKELSIYNNKFLFFFCL